MKLRQLEAMRAVMARGTTTHAGELIGLTQSAVSRLISQLEDELGFSLFDRRHGRLLITPEGQHFYEVAEKVLAGIDQIRATARDITTLGTGAVRIIAMPALGYGLLPATIADIRARYRQIKVSVDSGSRHEIEQGVSSAKYDFGLTTLPIEHESIDTEPLSGMDAVCIVPPGHRLAAKRVIRAADLTDEPFISMEPGTMFRYRTDEVFGSLGIRRKLGVEAQSTVTVCNMVAAGIGVALVHPFVANTFGGRLVIKRFEPAIRFEYGILFPSGVTRSQIAQEFAEALKASVAELAGESVASSFAGLG
ncbi:MAG: LysR family transcriptional regulator [Rhodospirillaceae bacterium]